MTPTATDRTATADDRHLLLRIVEEAYRQNTWNGTNLRSSLEHVSAHEAGWRPPNARHNIAEIVLHSAYWKFAVRKRLAGAGARQESFALEGKDWFEVAKPMEDDRWRELVAVLDDEHRKLCGAIRRSERDLQYGTSAGREIVRKLFGVAMHDAYHTGQVHLIQAQYKRANSK
jgi:hypothetical protein